MGRRVLALLVLLATFVAGGRLLRRGMTAGEDLGVERNRLFDQVLDHVRQYAVDSLDACGVYFGTTGGQVYASADAGDSWKPIVRDLPAVLSVEVQTLP